MMRALWFLLAFLIPLSQAGGATLYFDNTAGDGGDGTEATPFNAIADETDGVIDAGDTWLFKAGSVWTTPLIIDAVDDWQIGAYGCASDPCAEAEVPRFDMADAVEYGIYVKNSQGWQLRDVMVHNADRTNIFVEDTATVGTGIWTWTAPALLRVYADDSCAVDVFDGFDRSCKGILISGGEASGDCCGTYDGFIADSVTARHNGSMGFHAINLWTPVGRHLTLRKSYFEDNGAKKGGGNIWFHPQRGIQTGWVSAGTCTGCYNKTVSGTSTALRVVNPSANIALAPGTFDALAVNQFAQSGLIIQVRITGDVDPDTLGGVWILLSRANYIAEDNIARNARAADTVHGWGIAFDDGTEDSIMRRNLVDGADGWCAYYDGRNNRVEANILLNCGRAADHIDNNRACVAVQKNNTGGVIANNVMHNCGKDGVIHINSGSVALYNNSASNIGRSPYRAPGSLSMLLGANNNGFNYGSGPVAGNNAMVNTTTHDPQYVGGANPNTAAGFRLKPTSPLIGAGTCAYTTGCVPYDFEGKRARVPPDIGAFQRNP